MRTKPSASVRINTFGLQNNALNMAFVAPFKMRPADASLLFQLMGHSADKHLVRKNLFISNPRWQLMQLKKSDAGFDRWNIFVFVQICSSTEAIQIHHWHKKSMLQEKLF